MLNSCCKRLQLVLPNCRIVGDSRTRLQFFQRDAIFLRSFSSKSSLVSVKDEPQEQDHSFTFTVSYLINSCGLSPELALSASKKVHFDTRDRPDSILNVLRAHGVSDTDISQLVKKRPRLLLANAENTISPKLEFFGSVGISSTGLAQVLCSNPNILLRHNLERSIIPCYGVLKSLLVLDVNKVVRFFRSFQWVVTAKVLSNIVPNISVLRALQVPEASISSWVVNLPLVLSLETEKLKEIVKKVMSLGVPPSSATFVRAVHVTSAVDASEWAQKMDLYSKWGWTEDDFLLAFRKNPVFMSLSDKNFSSKMDFLVNKMGWRPADVAGMPTALTYSLEKLIIPRCSVIRILLLKGLLVRRDFSLGTVVIRTKNYFLNRFVIKYQEQIPELMIIYQGKMGLAELGLGFEESSRVNQL